MLSPLLASSASLAITLTINPPAAPEVLFEETIVFLYPLPQLFEEEIASLYRTNARHFKSKASKVSLHLGESASNYRVFVTSFEGGQGAFKVSSGSGSLPYDVLLSNDTKTIELQQGDEITSYLKEDNLYTVSYLLSQEVETSDNYEGTLYLSFETIL